MKSKIIAKNDPKKRAGIVQARGVLCRQCLHVGAFRPCLGHSGVHATDFLGVGEVKKSPFVQVACRQKRDACTAVLIGKTAQNVQVCRFAGMTPPFFKKEK